MDDEVRRAVKVELARRDMTQSDLAGVLGVKPHAVSRALGRPLGSRTLWPRMLAFLGLRLTAERVEK